jgi:serine/threonine-protein kinase
LHVLRGLGSGVTVEANSTAVGALVGGKYRIVRLLAQGGMGVVYEAHHAVVRRRFAIKFLRRDLALRREIITRFQREAEAAGALENENVAAAVDFGISPDGTPYIVMEYLVGESVGALLARAGALPAGRACDLVVQACRGIEAAHAAGIVHRDLKPHNLFLCRRDDGTDLVKVLDFGVAKLRVIESSNAATETGSLLGTASYMSPELARGDKSIDERADVYALGAILYELLSQQKPHPGDSQNAILHHIATQPAVPLDAERARVPVALADIIAGALASDPGARPRTAAALAASLAPFAAREVWPAPPLPAPADRPLEPARARPRRALLAALMLVPIAVAAGALWRGGRTTGEASGGPPGQAATTRGEAIPTPAPPPPAPAVTETARPVTAVAARAPDTRPQPAGRPTGRPSARVRRQAAVPPSAQTPNLANGVPPRAPKPTAAVPAFDDESPYE